MMNSRNEDIQAIKRLAADWRSGWLAGDVDALLSLYADEPVLMPQGQPVILGKDAIRPLYETVLKQVEIKSEGTFMEVETTGDWGYFWSTYKLTATAKLEVNKINNRKRGKVIVYCEASTRWCMEDHTPD